MSTVLKMIALVLSLGIDTLLLSISLSMIEPKGKWKIAGVFAFTEALMPLVGLAIGQTAGQLIGHWASIAGGIALIAVAAWLIFFEDEDEEEELERELIGWTLILTALSISIDELAVGFSIGLVGVPAGFTILLIALQAFVFTILGITFGEKLRLFFGPWAEKSAGIVLGMLGIWLLIEAVFKF